MRSFWLISLVALLIAGCTTIKPSHVTRDTSHQMLNASRITRYVPPTTSHLFKATLDIKKHHLTGLLVIKRMDSITPSLVTAMDGSLESPGVFRIVFVNEVGMTFFDLEMNADTFKVVSCFASLNKKTLMKILETNFRLLLWNGPMRNEKIYRQGETNNLVVSGNAGKYSTWQTYSPAGDTLFKTSGKSTIADPAIITFDKYANGTPLKIAIENPFIGIKLALRKLTKP